MNFWDNDFFYIIGRDMLDTFYTFYDGNSLTSDVARAKRYDIHTADRLVDELNHRDDTIVYTVMGGESGTDEAEMRVYALLSPDCDYHTDNHRFVVAKYFKNSETNKQVDNMDAETVRHRRMEKMKKELDAVAPKEESKKEIIQEDEDKKEGDCKDCRKRKIASSKKEVNKCSCKTGSNGCGRDENGLCRDNNNNPCWADDRGDRSTSGPKHKRQTQSSGDKRHRKNSSMSKCVLKYRAYDGMPSITKSASPTQMFVRSFEPLFVQTFAGKGNRTLAKSVKSAISLSMNELSKSKEVNKARLHRVDTDMAARMLIKSIRKAEQALPADADEQQAQIESADGNKEVLPADADDFEDENKETEEQDNNELPAEANDQEDIKQSRRKSTRKSKKSIRKADLDRLDKAFDELVDRKDTMLLSLDAITTYTRNKDDVGDYVHEIADECSDIKELADDLYYASEDMVDAWESDYEASARKSRKSVRKSRMDGAYQIVVIEADGNEYVYDSFDSMSEAESNMDADRIADEWEAKNGGTVTDVRIMQKSVRKGIRKEEEHHEISDDDVVEIEEEDGKKVVEIESKEDHAKEVAEGKEKESDNLNASRKKIRRGVRKSELPEANDQQSDIQPKAKSEDVLPEEANDQENTEDGAPKSKDVLPEEANEQEDIKQSKRKSIKRGVRKYSVTNGGSERYDGRQNYSQSPMMRQAIDNHFNSSEEELVKSFNARISAIKGQRRNPSIGKSAVPKVHGKQ